MPDYNMLLRAPNAGAAFAAGLQQADDRRYRNRLLENQDRAFGLQERQFGLQENRLALEGERFGEDMRAQRMERAASLAYYAKQNPASWPAIRQTAIREGLAPEDRIPQQFDPAFLDSVIAAGVSFREQIAANAPTQDRRPASIQEYEYARDNGYKGSYSDFIAQSARSELPATVQEWQYFNKLSLTDQERFLGMKRANRPVDIGGSVVTPSQTQPGTVTGEIPKTLAPDQQPETKGAQAQATAEGKATGERVGTAPERFNAATSALTELETQHEVLAEDIGRALDLVDSGWTTGLMGSLGSQVPGTDAYNLARLLDTIKANVGFDKLQAMREASPTGGALGSVTERENALLQSVLGSLEQSQSSREVKYNLNRLRQIIARRGDERRKAFERDFGKPFGGAEAKPDAPKAASEMSDEELLKSLGIK